MRLLGLLLPVVMLLDLVPRAAAYAVLTHEAIIDRNWHERIEPLLIARFPGTTRDQLREAHAYAYGGAILQDMGYYPFGSKFFSDLLHYVRSGDLVTALVRDAQDVNEYAFALGALAHYSADSEGHPIAVNRAVPVLYPKVGRKFGAEATYEDNPTAHLRTEFAFDVVQVARGKYASENYHDFIGFQVSKQLLERAFAETYGIELKSIDRDLDLSLGTFRFSVSEVMPEITKAAWAAKKKEIQQLDAGITREKYVYRLSRRDYHKAWPGKFERPGPGARFLAFLIRILPKIGPLRTLKFRVPTPEVEKMFFASFEDTMARYQKLLADVGANRLALVNENFDIGKPTRRGEYRMADETYSKLLEQLEKDGARVSQDLRQNVIAFYAGSDGPESQKAREELAAIRNTAQ